MKFIAILFTLFAFFALSNACTPSTQINTGLICPTDNPPTLIHRYTGSSPRNGLNVCKTACNVTSGCTFIVTAAVAEDNAGDLFWCELHTAQCSTSMITPPGTPVNLQSWKC